MSGGVTSASSHKAWLFVPCYVDQLMPAVGVAMVEVLERLGVKLTYPAQQTCCGQPALNSGYKDEAACVARRMVEIFAPAARAGAKIVVPSGSCAAMVKVFMPQMLAGTKDEAAAKAVGEATWEFCDYLVNVLGVDEAVVGGQGVAKLGAEFRHKVTVHDGCHGLRELGISEAPRKLLRGVKGLEIVEMGEAKTCCGFGGTFAVKYAQVSVAMAEVKCRSAAETGAEYIVSGDPSCLMQIGGYNQKQGIRLKPLHVAQVLASRGGSV